MPPVGVAPEPVVERTPRPVGRALFSQDWTRLVYVHRRYDPAAVAPFLPAGCVPDVDDDGAAWAGLVPFHMRRVRLLGTPPVPWLADFVEVNVRTYAVGPDGRRSVVFLTLEADRAVPVAVARAAYRLPYAWARAGLRVRPAGGAAWRPADEDALPEAAAGDEWDYATARRWPRVPVGSRAQARSRVHVRLTGRVDEPSPLDRFLTARWGLHVSWHDGRTLHGPVDHGPWPLWRAEVLHLDERLLRAVGLPAPPDDAPPHVLASPGVGVRLGVPHGVGRG